MGTCARWKGKTALITGASAGIGEAFARLLAADGCHLVLTARRRPRLEALREQLISHGVRIDVVAEDLADPGGHLRQVEAIGALGRPIDFLVNNAGFGKDGSFARHEWEDERAMIQVNVLSVAELTRRLLPAMLERGAGDILFVSSIAACIPIAGFATYAATKAYVTHFGTALGQELRGTGVRVTVLSPGGTDTEFLEVAGMAPTRVTRLGMMPALSVARIGLRAMAAGRRAVIAGWMNRFMIWFAVRSLPLGLRLRAGAIFQKLAGGGKS